MTDLQNTLIELANNGQVFKCKPYDGGWVIITLTKDNGDIMAIIDFDKDQHKKNLTYDGNTMNWKEINNFCPSIKLNDIFHIIRGRRVNTLISRFIKYNLDCFNDGKLKFYHSEIKQGDIPKLASDKGLIFLENYIFKKIIAPNYEDNYILSSSKIQIAKIQTLFYILNESNLIKNNKSLSEFMNSLNSSLFKKYNNEWKICYLIANLSCDEVKIIFDRYHQRDTKFELNLEDINLLNI